MDTVDEAAYTKLITKAEYPLLSDPTGLVIKAYGVYDLLGDGVATPSVFIIRSDGSISWSYIAKDIKDRPTTDEILNHIE
jgi:peroxiredoxin